MKIFRRHYNRYNLHGKGKIDDTIEFEVLNISASGVMVKTIAHLEKDKIINIKMILSGQLYHKKMSVEGRVVRLMKEGSSNIYGIGFTNITEKDRIEIDEIVRGLMRFYG